MQKKRLGGLTLHNVKTHYKVKIRECIITSLIIDIYINATELRIQKLTLKFMVNWSGQEKQDNLMEERQSLQQLRLGLDVSMQKNESEAIPQHPI